MGNMSVRLEPNQRTNIVAGSEVASPRTQAAHLSGRYHEMTDCPARAALARKLCHGRLEAYSTGTRNVRASPSDRRSPFLRLAVCPAGVYGDRLRPGHVYRDARRFARAVSRLSGRGAPQRAGDRWARLESGGPVAEECRFPSG